MIEIATIEVNLDKTHLFKHVEIPFSVENEYHRLVVSYQYFPKRYEGDDAYELAYNAFKEAYGESEVRMEDVLNELPLNNHVTLSIAREGKLLGTAHRHSPNMEIELSKTPTVGFHSIDSTKGEYKLILSVHALLTECVNASIKVTAYERV